MFTKKKKNNPEPTALLPLNEIKPAVGFTVRDNIYYDRATAIRVEIKRFVASGIKKETPADYMRSFGADEAVVFVLDNIDLLLPYLHDYAREISVPTTSGAK